MSNPEDGQRVEIFVANEWKPAKFVASDYIWGPGMGDEVYWFDYFRLDDGETVPEDVTSGDKLPKWREPKK